MKFEKAKRTNTNLLISLVGKSGSGKTFSALTIAQNLGGKTLLIDTENKRSTHYANFFDFYVVHIAPPYTPEVFIKILDEAEQEGFDTIIIDSMSHEWQGDGGVIDIAETSLTKGGKKLQGLAKWGDAKMRHNRLFSRINRVKCHLILNLRGKDSLIQSGVHIIDNGLKEVQDKNLLFDMSFVFFLSDNGKASIFKIPLGTEKKINLPIYNKSLNFQNTYIDKNIVDTMKSWASAGEEIEIDKAKIKARAYEILSSDGLDSLKVYYKSIAADLKRISAEDKKEIDGYFYSITKELENKKIVVENVKSDLFEDGSSSSSETHLVKTQEEQEQEELLEAKKNFDNNNKND